MSKPGRNNAHHRKPDVRPCLVKDQDLDTSLRRDFRARENVLAQVVRRYVREVLQTSWCGLGIGHQIGSLGGLHRAPPTYGVLASSISTGRGRAGGGRDCLQRLVQLRERPCQSDAGVKVCAEAVDDVLFGFVYPPRQRSKCRYAKIARDVECPEVTPKVAVVTYEPRDVCVVDALEIHGPPSQSVVPPQGDGVPLYQLKQPLQHGLFDDGTCGATVGVGSSKQWILTLVSVIAKRRRQVAQLFGRQRPEWGPLDLGILSERLRYPVGLVSSRVV